MKKLNLKNFEKSNILLLGPTGTGKTLLAKTLASTTQIPIVICDATSLTAAGYVGDDVDSIIHKLLDVVHWDVSKAEQGIVYLDEIDKIAKKYSSRYTKDVGGESVQHGLLKILEGSKINIVKKGGVSNNLVSVTVDTSNILFICAGAFTGIESIVARRTMSRSLGFTSPVSAGFDEKTMQISEKDRLLQNVEPADLTEYGLIPEFVGRFSTIASTHFLTEHDMYRILCEPTNSIIDQMKGLFAISFPKPVHLIFTEKALRAIAKIGISRGSGARGLRVIVERLLCDCQFELAEKPYISYVVVEEVEIGKVKCLEMTNEQFEVWSQANPTYRPDSEPSNVDDPANFSAKKLQSVA